MQTAAPAATPLFDELFSEVDPVTQRVVLDSFDMELDPNLKRLVVDPTFDDQLLPAVVGETA